MKGLQPKLKDKFSLAWGKWCKLIDWADANFLYYVIFRILDGWL